MVQKIARLVAQVGTEHVLAVLALGHGSRAHRVRVDLGVDIASVKKELAR